MQRPNCILVVEVLLLHGLKLWNQELWFFYHSGIKLALLFISKDMHFFSIQLLYAISIARFIKLFLWMIYICNLYFSLLQNCPNFGLEIFVNPFLWRYILDARIITPEMKDVHPQQFSLVFLKEESRVALLMWKTTDGNLGNLCYF